MEKEKCILVAIYGANDHTRFVEASLDELSKLIDTAGGEEVARVVQRRQAPDPSTYLGKGKATEVKSLATRLGATCLVVDGPLRPAQEAALSKLTGLRVRERTDVILEIFAMHARSAEGKLQVKMAELQYKLGRLRGKGSELSRLGGGMGTRGPGEQRLEEERRRIRRQLGRVSRQLERLDKTRQANRKLRTRSGVPLVALVGYTNVGKSTLLRRLTGAEVAIEDKLFSTLDPHTGRTYLASHRQEILVIDTVGFVRELPPELLRAFKATLDEISSAHLIVHVVDGASLEAAAQIRVVRELLGEMGAGEIPEILAVNKCDLMGTSSHSRVERLLRESHTPHGVPWVLLSAESGEGVDRLRNSIGECLFSDSPETFSPKAHSFCPRAIADVATVP